MNRSERLREFASALERAAALAREIANDKVTVELKVDEEMLSRAYQLAIRDNPPGPATSAADSEKE